MKNKILYKVMVLILFANLTTNCIKEDVVLTDPQKYTRPINFAGPIANIHFGAKDLLETIDSSSFFQIDEEGLIHFRYDTALNTILEDIIQFEKLSIEGDYDIGIKKGAAPVTFVDSIVTNKDPNQRFDSLILKESMLTLSVNCPSGFTGTYEISFPEIITPDGQPVIFTGNLSSDKEESKDLANAKIFFLNQDDKSFCRVISTINVEGIDGVPANSLFGVTVTLDPFLPDYIFGYFGQTEVMNQKQAMPIDFFKTLNISDAIQFKDIRLDVFINNYMGAPMEFGFDTILLSNETSGNFVDVNFNDGTTTLLVNPADYADPIVPNGNTLSYNADNSNLIDGINIAPTEIYTSFIANINPDGETQQNFLHTDLEIEGSISIDIPFWFKTSTYERTDTMEFDFTNMLDSSQVDYLEELNLYFVFTNGFPFNIEAQAYFVDSNYQKVDSMFNDGSVLFWKSGIIDASGKVSSPSVTNVDIQILQEKAKNMYDNKTRFILFKSNVSTGDLTNPEFVKLFDSYSMDAKLTGEIKSGEIKF